MLRLKKIELVGFKSFHSREKLLFSGTGVAAVVGPNGCGKSNLCDAVSWVLGEQSAKSLRGGRMHDVIFSGTRMRKQAGMAMVSLTLQDHDGDFERAFAGRGKMPAKRASGEIEVTRKLFSSGTSQYILNGKVVRLRDVRQLFLGTGLGPNHYAIIEQGRIGQLLAARALERRAFVEEAAGVTRFEARRSLAEQKLASARLNLERLGDILQEVRRQSRSLKRQAGRAERHERLAGRLREAQETWFSGRYGELSGRREALESRVSEARKRTADAELRVGVLEAQLERCRQDEAARESSLEGDREELSSVLIAMERRSERLRQQAAAATANDASVQRDREELEDLDGRILDLERQAEQRRLESASIDSEVRAMRRELQARDSAIGSRQSRVDRLAELGEACRRELFAALSARSDTEGSLGRFEAELAGHDSSIQRRERAALKAEQDLGPLQDRQRSLEAEAGSLQAAVRERAEQVEQLSGAVAAARTRMRQVRSQRDGCAAELSRLVARRDSTLDILRDRDFGAETVTRILRGAASSAGHLRFRPLGVLAEFLDVDARYAVAVEKFLAEDLDQVVVGNWEDADRGVRLVREKFQGRATFVLAHSAAEPPATVDSPSPAETVPIASLVRVVDRNGGAVPSWVPKIARGFLVGSRPRAQLLAESNPSLYFLVKDGTWYHGRSVHGACVSAAGPLVLKQSLDELTPRLEAAETRLDAARAAIQRQKRRVSEQSDARAQARARLRGLRESAAQAAHGLGQVRRRISDCRAARSSAIRDVERLRTQRSDCESGRRAALQAQERLAGECERLEAQHERLGRQERAARESLSSMLESRSVARAAAAKARERLLSAGAALAAAESMAREQRQAQQALRARILDLERRNERLAASNRDLEKRIADGLKSQGVLESRIGARQGKLGESRTATSRLARALKDGREEEASSRKGCSAVEVSLARVEAELEHLGSDCVSELGDSLEEVAARAGETAAPDSLADLAGRIRELRTAISQLGAVNVLAAKEYKAVSERQAFLEGQQADLEQSMANTCDAIKEIASRCRERFDDAFKGINRNFRDTFASLFGGGTGELRLTDPGNWEESGVEIVAQPPGKRLQRVALLSGGEKSLTVMALLMATFRYRPSPFCVLDEVDSQLDDSNTLRLRGLLMDMASETQFVVITHSKLMMEAAEALYGVTMGEPGVSQLVSVRMGGHRQAGHRRQRSSLGRVAGVA